MRVAYTGHAYQLYHIRKLRPGAYVEINGPHDTYGIIRSEPVWFEEKKAWLYQIRGVPKDDFKVVEASF